MSLQHSVTPVPPRDDGFIKLRFKLLIKHVYGQKLLLSLYEVQFIKNLLQQH